MEGGGGNSYNHGTHGTREKKYRKELWQQNGPDLISSPPSPLNVEEEGKVERQNRYGNQATVRKKT